MLHRFRSRPQNPQVVGRGIPDLDGSELPRRQARAEEAALKARIHFVRLG